MRGLAAIYGSESELSSLNPRTVAIQALLQRSPSPWRQRAKAGFCLDADATDGN